MLFRPSITLMKVRVLSQRELMGIIYLDHTLCYNVIHVMNQGRSEEWPKNFVKQALLSLCRQSDVNNVLLCKVTQWLCLAAWINSYKYSWKGHSSLTALLAMRYRVKDTKGWQKFVPNLSLKPKHRSKT